MSRYSARVIAALALMPLSVVSGALAEAVIDQALMRDSDLQWANLPGAPTTDRTCSVPQTGQDTSWVSRDDGDLRRGVPWPNPRFTDNGDGTVTDNLTGLIWLKNAACFQLQSWAQAVATASNMASGQCGLTDGSVAGDWVLPNVRELLSLVHYGVKDPAVPNTAGTGQWSEGDPFSASTVGTGTYYWSSTALATSSWIAWGVHMAGGSPFIIAKWANMRVWPVRGGQSANLSGVPTTVRTCSVQQTGQDTSWVSRDDGDLRRGVPWPNPRFTDNGDGTVTDNLTGLIWAKNFACFQFQTWAQAVATAENMASGVCGLTDGSVPGDWVLPNVRELLSLVHYGVGNPAVPNTAGTGQWTTENPFVRSWSRSRSYWSSTSLADQDEHAWAVNLDGAGAAFPYPKTNTPLEYIYPFFVRHGQPNQDPTADAGFDQTVPADSVCRAQVTLDGTASFDPDGDDLTYSWLSPAGDHLSGPTPVVGLALGDYTFTLTVDDGFGGVDTDEVTITVEDATAPTIDSLMPIPGSLWPPDHTMRPVGVSAVASDNCDPTPVCEIADVACNEPVNGTGDGDTAPDWIVTGDLSLDLRAERAGEGDGRVYTIGVECSDAAGNGAIAGTEVLVPHNR